MPSAASRPAAIASRRRSPIAAAATPVQIAADGTSLIGESAMKSAIGLTAASAADAMPATGPARRLPSTNAAHTKAPAEIGTTRYGPIGSARRIPIAISSGRPGA